MSSKRIIKTCINGERELFRKDPVKPQRGGETKKERQVLKKCASVFLAVWEATYTRPCSASSVKAEVKMLVNVFPSLFCGKYNARTDQVTVTRAAHRV